MKIHTLDLNSRSYISISFKGETPISSKRRKTHFVFKSKSQLLCSRYFTRKAARKSSFLVSILKVHNGKSHSYQNSYLNNYRVYIHKYKKPLLKINSSFEKVEWVKYRHSYLHGIRYIITTIKPTYPEESICLIWYTIFQSATECYVDLLLSASNSYLWLLQFLQYQNKRLKI